jgi:hypothetical protein
VATAPTVTTVRASQCIVFGAHEMFASRTAMAASAKNPYLIYEI